MNIYDISGSVWLSDVPLTASCEVVQELMKEDYAQLVWNSASNAVIPVGAYILLDGERYSILEPYTPEQRTEAEWVYRPKFQSAYRALSKVPFFMYTTVDGTTTKEADWSLTDNALNFMAVLCDAIHAETGLKYDKAVGSDVAVASATCAFNCTDIQSAITEIANAFDTEIWLEKYAQADGNGYIGKLHMGKAQHGEAVELEVGVNVKVPSVTRNGEYFNRFYVFGSARNITQDYAGANVNNLATKRLTLSPTDYPGGYIDFSDGGQVFSKVLIFEDIYPAATDLVVMNIRSWLRYRRDESTSEKIVIGTDPETGDPVYDMYAVWFVNLKRKVGGEYVDFDFDNTTYDREDNPTGMLLPGLVPSFHFTDGPLAGREFEVIYHDTAETVKDGTDGSTFSVQAGDFEIKFVEEGTYIIPAVTGLVPQTDDHVVLFNVMMPSDYVSDAEGRLETAALEEINRSYLDTATLAPVDRNSYQVDSDPTVFYASDPGLTLGRRVLYINGTYEKESRVTKLVRKLDRPCYQTITFGDDIIKGSIEELKEEAVSANRNIDLLAALNKTTAELTAAYERSHQLILKQLADQASMWLVVDGAVKLNPIYAGVWTEGWMAAGGVGDDGGGGGGGLITSVKGVADIGTPIVTESLTETFSSKAIESIYEAVQDRATALSLTSGGAYLLDSDGKPLKDSNGNYLVAGGDSSKVLNLLNEAGEVISSVELPIPTIDSPFVTVGGATIELGGSASLTDIGVPGWAQDEELAFGSLPSLFIGRTTVKSTGDTNDILLGINGFTSEGTSGVSGDKSMVVWEPDGGGTGIGAWHFKGNVYVDGWLASGGVGENGGGFIPRIENLEDVSLESLSDGDLLQWDGEAWVNVPKSGIVSLTNSASHSVLEVGGTSVAFYDKDQVDLKIGAVNPFDYVPVQTLPTADSSTLGKIYMLGPDNDNVYTLYYTKEEGGAYSWVPFGTTEINLSGYVPSEEFAQETDRVENYQQLVANGGVYRVKLDETKRMDESGMVQRRTNSDQNYAVLTEISVNDVYSISINTKYKYEFLWHAKSSLVTDQFTRAGVWLTGQTILSSLPFYENADRLRIRIYSEDSDGNPVVFATMVEDLNPVIRTWREILEPVPAQVEVLRSGSLVTPGAYPSNTRLFDTSIAKAGDIINYELNNTTPVGSYSQYFAIGFYNSEGTRLTYIGYDGTALSGAYTARGTVQIPEGFAYAAITDWGGMTIVSMTTNESLDAVYSKLNNTIQKNSLFDGDLSLEIVEGSDTTQNIKVADVPFDKGGLPEYLYIKCDAVSNLNLADYPLRFDCYKWVGLTLTRFAYRFYHKSNIGRYVKFDLPTDTDVVRLIASVTVDSTASAQNITYTGVKLSLAPSDKEFSISGTTFVREHDEYGRGTYDDEIDDTVDKIVALSAKPCLVLNILTDTHENRQLRASVDITTMTLSNVKAVSRKAFSDGLVHMGDILAAGQASQYMTWDEVNDHLSEYVGRLREINERCFVCVGNHDGLEGNYVDEAHTYGSLEQFNERYVVREGIAPWFYKDYEKIRTRVVFLAVPSRDCAENGSIRYGIGENQMRWVAQTALGVPDGWNVLFFSHIHPYSGFEAGDATIFAGLTTAFCERSTYSYDGDYSLSVDFSQRTSGRVLALVAGHTHADAVIEDDSVFTSYDLSFPIIVIASSNRLVGGNASPGYTNPTRIENTVSEDLWDTLVYRPDLDKIYMVRFGAGNDREIDV